MVAIMHTFIHHCIPSAQLFATGLRYLARSLAAKSLAGIDSKKKIVRCKSRKKSFHRFFVSFLNFHCPDLIEHALFDDGLLAKLRSGHGHDREESTTSSDLDTTHISSHDFADSATHNAATASENSATYLLSTAVAGTDGPNTVLGSAKITNSNELDPLRKQDGSPLTSLPSTSNQALSSSGVVGLGPEGKKTLDSLSKPTGVKVGESDVVVGEAKGVAPEMVVGVEKEASSDENVAGAGSWLSKLTGSSNVVSANGKGSEQESVAALNTIAPGLADLSTIGLHSDTTSVSPSTQIMSSTDRDVTSIPTTLTDRSSVIGSIAEVG